MLEDDNYFVNIVSVSINWYSSGTGPVAGSAQNGTGRESNLITNSSVNLQSLVKSSKSFVLMLLNSKREPIILPNIAPNIVRLIFVLPSYNYKGNIDNAAMAILSLAKDGAAKLKGIRGIIRIDDKFFNLDEWAGIFVK